MQVVLGEAELRKQLVVATDKIIELKEQLASSTSDQEKQFVSVIARVCHNDMLLLSSVAS